MLSYFVTGNGLAAQLTVNNLDDVVATDGQCTLREGVEVAKYRCGFQRL